MEVDNIRYKKAFTEVYILINDLVESLYIKIPLSFVKMIKDNMDKTYNITIDELKNNGILNETEDIMALVYRDYLCDAEEKKKLLRKDDESYKERNSVKFHKIEPIEKDDSSTAMMVVNEKWYNKVINFFKGLFKKD